MNHSIDVHNPYYFRDYILSHFTGRKLEQIAIFHAAFVAQQYAADSTNQEVYDEISRSYKLDGITPFFYNSMELLMDIFHTKKQSLDKLLLVDIDGRT